jgi:VanZ family protein
MAVIFYASSLPDLQEIPLGVSDHTGHFTGYAILGALVVRALARARWSGVTPGASIGAIALSSIYGVSDELHQHFVHGRTPAVDDWVADTLGAAAAVAIVFAAAVVVRRARTRSV